MFTDKVSKPEELTRYRYIAVLVTIIVIIVLIQGKSVFTVNIPKIKLKGLLVYLGVIVALFIMYNKYYNNQNEATQKDLNNAWSFFHACFYFGLAYFVPNNWPLVVIFMVGWELFEDHMGYNVGRKEFIETDGKKMFDMICNSSGYLLGSIAFRERWANKSRF